MKKHMFLFFLLCLTVLTLSSEASEYPAGKSFNFDDILYLSVDEPGLYSQSSSKDLVVFPESGGMLSVEYASIENPDNKVTKNKLYELMQLWTRQMASNYSKVFVPRRDITEDNFGHPLFHTQDYSSDFLGGDIASDGYLVFTQKGAVVLWFSSFPENMIQDRFIASVLASLSTVNEGEGEENFLTKEAADELATKEKLHHVFWKCEDISFKKISRTPYDYVGKYSSYTGTVIQVIENGLDTILRVKLNEEYQRTDDVLYVEYHRSNIRDSRILDDDKVTIYGKLDGLETYSTVLGAQASNPRMIAYYIDIWDD